MSGILKLYLLGDLPRLRNEVPATFTPAVKFAAQSYHRVQVSGKFGACMADVRLT
jgi:hypothetical protein